MVSDRDLVNNLGATLVVNAGAEKAMLDGGPMHGIRRVLAELSAITLPQFGGSYRRIGRNEAGIAMFKWEKA